MVECIWVEKVMIKRLFAITIITFCIPVFAEETPATQNPLTVLQNINIEQCAKIYGISQDKLFNLTLASISANRFKVEEIQTAMGYIIFGVNRGKYIATITQILFSELHLVTMFTISRPEF